VSAAALDDKAGQLLVANIVGGRAHQAVADEVSRKSMTQA
jgi:hypothetical protein